LKLIYMGKRSVSLTLVELLVSIALFSVIMLALTAISAFSYRTIIDSSRRSDIQQDAALVVEHVTSNVKRAIGSTIGPTPGFQRSLDGNTIAMRVDRVPLDGIPNDDANGQWIAYNYIPGTYKVEYFANANCPSLGGGWPTSNSGDALSSRITNFSLIPTGGRSHVYIFVIACYDPDNSPLQCGAKGNPSIAISANIDMPMMSSN